MLPHHCFSFLNLLGKRLRKASGGQRLTTTAHPPRTSHYIIDLVLFRLPPPFGSFGSLRLRRRVRLTHCQLKTHIFDLQCAVCTQAGYRLEIYLRNKHAGKCMFKYWANVSRMHNMLSCSFQLVLTLHTNLLRQRLEHLLL